MANQSHFPQTNLVVGVSVGSVAFAMLLIAITFAIRRWRTKPTQESKEPPIQEKDVDSSLDLQYELNGDSPESTLGPHELESGRSLGELDGRSLAELGTDCIYEIYATPTSALPKEGLAFNRSSQCY